jgi:hypothetical protein
VRRRLLRRDVVDAADRRAGLHAWTSVAVDGAHTPRCALMEDGSDPPGRGSSQTGPADTVAAGAREAEGTRLRLNGPSFRGLAKGEKEQVNAPVRWYEPTGIVALLSVVVLVLLLAPVYRVAVETPFRLIDDYLDWHTTLGRSWPPTLLRYLAHFGAGRYRPGFDVGTSLYWWAFGVHAQLHHAARIAMRLLTFVLAWASVRRVAADVAGRTGRSWRLEAFAYAASLFLFFPNNPEARLAPQELAVGLAFVAVVASLVVVGVGSRLGYATSLVAFALLCVTKETAVPVAGVMLPWIHHELREASATRVWPRFMPFLLVVAHTVAKVGSAAIAGGYGTAPITPRLVLINLKYAVSYVLLPLDGLWLPLLVLLPLLYLARSVRRLVGTERRVARWPLPAARTLGLTLAAVASLATFLTSWTPALRYAYPSVVAVLLLNALGVSIWLAGGPGAGRGEGAMPWRGAVALLLALLFAVATYSDLVAQFAQQQVAGRSEAGLLGRIRGLQHDGKAVAVGGDSEYERSLRIACSGFSDSDSGPVAAVNPGVPARPGELLISSELEPRPWKLLQRIDPASPPALVRRSRALSSVAPLRPRGMHAFVDSGSKPLAYFPWYLYVREKTSNATRRGATP